MFKTVFSILLLAHVLGDYYLQTQKLAKEKAASIGKVILHSGIYAGVMLLLLFPVWNPGIFYAALLSSISHLAVDLVKYIFTNERPLTEEKDRDLYLIDQMIHLAFLVFAAFLACAVCDSLVLPSPISFFLKITNANGRNLLTWTLLILLAGKPANVTIKKILFPYRPKETVDGDKKAGGFIGLLERLIILMLLGIQQYSAIALVLTAKSIARYDKISKDKEFAEYYLLGTLLSTAMVMVSYLALA